MKRILSITILFMVCGSVLVFAVFLVRSAVAGETNIDLLTPLFYPCEEIVGTKSGRMVVVRIDDVQAHAWEEISIRMMDEAKERRIPLVLGVIPRGIGGSDRMYGYLRANRCHLEIAQHGWDHNSEVHGESPEFRGLSKEEALGDVLKGKNILERLARERMVTFIPPNNEMSTGTAAALIEANIPVVSSEGPAYFDFGATVFDYDTDGMTSMRGIVDDCEKRFSISDLCVIMVHPQNFFTDGVLDEQKYALYPELLETLSREGASFVRFKDLIEFDRTYEPWKDFLPSF